MCFLIYSFIRKLYLHRQERQSGGCTLGTKPNRIFLISHRNVWYGRRVCLNNSAFSNFFSSLCMHPPAPNIKKKNFTYSWQKEKVYYSSYQFTDMLSMGATGNLYLYYFPTFFFFISRSPVLNSEDTWEKDTLKNLLAHAQL